MAGSAKFHSATPATQYARIPLFSLPGHDNCWYTPSRGPPCWFLGPSIWWAQSVLVGVGPVHCFAVPSSPLPVPRTQCQRGCQPCPALPGHALACPGFPSPTWKVPARPPLPSDPTSVSRTRPPPSRSAACLSLFPPSPPHTTTTRGLVARLLSFPRPHPRLTLTSGSIPVGNLQRFPAWS